ncbi:hypothetical protein [Prosthecochloris sp. SCSIO W1101]
MQRMKKLSPHYTTRREDIVKVREYRGFGRCAAFG